MGYDPRAITLVLNRADSSVGITPLDVEQVLGRAPDVLVGSDRAILARSERPADHGGRPEVEGGAVVRNSGGAVPGGPAPGGRVQRQRAAAAAAAEGELTMELHERIANSPAGAARRERQRPAARRIRSPT